ncbi:MAG: putative ABC transport system ATP-binding protein [Candidatus Saganbacteria bacterium]|uniref:Putative ABC transport system ATP-binding protein n=1 Tax=Candidatus Saganbacteria bacterium TaxID=2575572 RepID=A0A833L0Z8_UNCSA|nr:MAG: putative ABC transport system ATP-binding protein [Candidatus Saganbacteria bacterium]
MIKIENIKKKFNGHFVLDGISLTINEGETVAVIGPSGCGKSTLLKLINRLEEPTSGKIIIDGQNIFNLSEDELVKFRQKIGMVFQSSALFDSLSVFENVAFALREHTQLNEREINKIVLKKMELVDLLGKENMMPSELSGGMQKRVSVARAIAINPKIILYDEPTTGLDPITSVTIENLINKLAKELKVTSIVVTHQLSTIFRTANRIIMLDNGKFIESGTPEKTKESNNPIIKTFINSGVW